MKKNMGLIDRAIRILLAVIIVILAFTKVITGFLAVILLILAAVFVFTGIFGWCPLYLPFGFRTKHQAE